MRQQRKDIVLARPAEDGFREAVEDGTMECVVDARLRKEDLTLLKLLYPAQEELLQEPLSSVSE